MNDALKYYSLIIICYLIELYIFNFFKFSELIKPEIINFFIRFIMVIFAAVLIKIYVFPDKNNFFKIFFFLSIINPLISSISLFFLYKVFEINIMSAKIIGDILTSILLFIILKISLKYIPFN